MISSDLAGFHGHLLERLVAGIVNVSDRRELKPGEPLQIGQAVSIQVDVIETRGSENGSKGRCAKQKANQRIGPITPPQAGLANASNRSQGSHSHALEPGAN